MTAEAVDESGTIAPEPAPVPLEVLIRATNTEDGTTYLYWLWLDDVAERFVHIITTEDLASVTTRLAEAMISGLPGETEDESARRALVDGALADRHAEKRLSSDLGALVLPPQFWVRLLREAARTAVTLRITPSRTLARVPWELMVAPHDGRRLVEIATLVYAGPSSSVNFDRARLPEPFDSSRPVLRTLDPVVPAGAGLGPVLSWNARTHLRNELGLDRADVEPKRISRGDLRDLLQATERPSRWIHVGHVSANDEAVGSAALHLTDEATWYGWAEPVGPHRPLTALDLHLGTSKTEVRKPELWYPAEEKAVGAEIWPMPPRVAIIACDSGADHAGSETFGLVVTALISGAEYVTSTRWTVPTDEAFTRTHPELAGVLPTSDLIVAVDRAHAAEDPVAALREWQLAKLRRWEVDGNIVDSPILFAGITTHHAPPRPELRSLDEAEKPATAMPEK